MGDSEQAQTAANNIALLHTGAEPGCRKRRVVLASAPDGAIKTALADIADFVVERAY
jgi:hypothetical protein